MIDTGTAAERQDAVRLLSGMASPKVDDLIGRLLDSLAEEKIPPAVRLDLRLAAGSRESTAIKEKLAAWESKRSSMADIVDRYADTLEGGDEKEGAKIFFEKGAVACLKCHKVGDRGGEVGPDLSKIAEKKRPESPA